MGDKPMQVTEALNRPTIKLSRILLPTEHGSWAFLLEPLIAGCVLFFSPAALWLGVMTFAAFLSRQPLKTYFLTRGSNPVSSAALQFSMLFLASAAGALFVSMWASGPALLVPAAVGAALGAEQFRNDISRNGRSLWAEVTGAAAISSSISMMAIASGADWKTAAAMWAIFALRLAPSIVYVRNRLMLEKGKQFDRFTPIVAHAASFAAIIAFTAYGLASALTAGMFAFLLVRCSVGLSSFRSRMKAMKIGVWEVVYGTMTLLSIILGYYAGI